MGRWRQWLEPADQALPRNVVNESPLRQDVPQEASQARPPQRGRGVRPRHRPGPGWVIASSLLPRTDIATFIAIAFIENKFLFIDLSNIALRSNIKVDIYLSTTYSKM